jgi:hypothetical protein
MPFFSRDAIPHHLVESPPEKMHAHPRSFYQVVLNFSRVSASPIHAACTLQRAVGQATSFRQTWIQLLCQIANFHKKAEMSETYQTGDQVHPGMRVKYRQIFCRRTSASRRNRQSAVSHFVIHSMKKQQRLLR